jgi:hypothetical protein
VSPRSIVRTVVLASAVVPALAVVLATAACSDASAPEEQIRALVREVETAAEARDVGDVLARVSDEYADEAGRTRADLGRLVRGWFALHPALELVTRVESVEIESDDYARARVTVGVVARRGAPEDWDAALDVRTIDVRLRRDGGEWRAIAANWERGPR